MQPSNHTPLIALPVLALDLETTGLDVRRDRVVEIAALSLLGDTLHEPAVLDQRIQPGIAIPAAASRIHHIHDGDVIKAPRLESILARLAEHTRDRILFGHHIGFDSAILRHEYARRNQYWPEPMLLDLVLIAGALKPGLMDITLETVCDMLGVEIQQRHSAMGDCLAAVHCWQKLIPLLRDKGIRNLGELHSLTLQRDDIIRHQFEAGWLLTPGPAIEISATPAIDSYIFAHRVKDVMRSPVYSVKGELSVQQTAAEMLRLQVGALLVDVSGQMQGMVTERDLLKVCASPPDNAGAPLVAQIMSQPIACIEEDALLYRALARMDRLSIRHLCVTDTTGAVTGMLSQRDLLRYRARGANTLNESILLAKDTTELALAYARVVVVAGQLVNEDLSARVIARVISSEIQVLTQRACELALQRMQQDGEGEAPASWCVLVLGSAGRGESLLHADQDNALIYDGPPEHDDWFARFGEYLADILDQAGLLYCQGEVMVRTALWRGNLQQWQMRLSHWFSQATPQDLLNVDIFFDLQPVAGELSLAQSLYESAIEQASESRAFLNLMVGSVQSLLPRFSLFGRLPQQQGRLDLKRDGLLPLVSFARTLALRTACSARSTQQRLQVAEQQGKISSGDVHRLNALHENLLKLILQQQILDIQQGLTPGNHVVVTQLSKAQRRALRVELQYLSMMLEQLNSFVTY